MYAHGGGYGSRDAVCNAGRGDGECQASGYAGGARLPCGEPEEAAVWTDVVMVASSATVGSAQGDLGRLVQRFDGVMCPVVDGRRGMRGACDRELHTQPELHHAGLRRSSLVPIPWIDGTVDVER